MNRNKKQDSVIVKLTLDYALQIVDFTQKLKEKKFYPLADQLFRSGTSIGANTWEAQSAESKKDFVHKLKIAAKEADETEFWLTLCKLSNHLPSPDDNMFSDLESIEKVLSKIISTTKRNM